MTGYGKIQYTTGNKLVTIEMRAVNSKQLDINIRMPTAYKEKELDIRNEINKQVIRGKLDFLLFIEQSETDKPVLINTGMVKEYYNELKALATECNLPVTEQLLISALRMPDTTKSETIAIPDNEWTDLMTGLANAFIIFNNFRLQEGKALETDILHRVELIETALNEISKYETERVTRIKERLQKNLNEFIPAASIDANRFEQEIIYFLEKLDITEEKVRLNNHCEYFRKTIVEESSGRKLGFIAQEMGREINTIGSKANHAEIQKHVVQMKDELEKIKEQLLNIL